MSWFLKQSTLAVLIDRFASVLRWSFPWNDVSRVTSISLHELTRISLFLV